MKKIYLFLIIIFILIASNFWITFYLLNSVTKKVFLQDNEKMMFSNSNEGDELILTAKENKAVKAFVLNTQANGTGLSEFKKALQEVAYAYYMRGPQIQYNSMKVSYYSPEEATSQNINYMVCSGFNRNVYNELLNIKTPNATSDLLNYGKKYIGDPEVIAYGYKDKIFADENNDGLDDALEITEEELNQNRSNFGSQNGDLLMWFGDGETKKNPSLNNVIPYLQVRRFVNRFRTYFYDL